MKKRILLLFAIVSVLVLIAGCSKSIDTPALAVIEAQNHLKLADLWPDFKPGDVPVAIYDGTRTLLSNHPSPPEGFKPLPGYEHVWVYEGRYPEITANSTVKIGNILTAVIMIDQNKFDGRALPDSIPPECWAAIVIHESFHVFQQEQHPDWQANDALIFDYPYDDTLGLAYRRMVIESLQRALESADEDSAAGWAERALQYRTERYKRMEKEISEYERNLELVEGTAHFIENYCQGDHAPKPLSQTEFPVEEFRHRAYYTGEALCALLERFEPDWKKHLEEKKGYSLDDMLSDALEDRDAAQVPLLDQQFRIEHQEAGNEIASLEAKRDTELQEYLSQPGWKLIIEISDSKNLLWPAGFDPMNVEVLKKGEILHSRWLKLSNQSADFEAMNRPALTIGLNGESIFHGVREIIVSGLQNPPSLVQQENQVTISGEGINATFQDVDVMQNENEVRITL